MGDMDDATRLRLLEQALRFRDWMAVMDVVEDMGGDPRIHVNNPPKREGLRGIVEAMQNPAKQDLDTALAPVLDRLIRDVRPLPTSAFHGRTARGRARRS